MISVTAVAPRPLWHDIYKGPGLAVLSLIHIGDIFKREVINCLVTLMDTGILYDTIHKERFSSYFRSENKIAHFQMGAVPIQARKCIFSSFSNNSKNRQCE